MAEVSVNKLYLDVEQSFIVLPNKIIENVKKVVAAAMVGTRSQLHANVSGGVLHTVTGDLASKIRSSTRSTRITVSGRAGSKAYIGRFWEDGFVHRTRKGKRTPMAPRKWAQPVVDAVAPRLAADIEAAIDASIRGEGL